MRPMIRMFVLVFVFASPTAAFAIDKMMDTFPLALRPMERHFRQAYTRWNVNLSNTV
jgi:hypothetical protein